MRKTEAKLTAENLKAAQQVVKKIQEREEREKNNPTYQHKTNTIAVPSINVDAKLLKVLPADNLLRISDSQFIYRWDMKKFVPEKDGKRVCVLGGSGSGKSRFVVEAMRECANVPVWQVLNPSEPANPMYGPHLPCDGCVVDDQEPEKLLLPLYKLKVRQFKRCKEWRIPKSDPAQWKRDPSIGLIMDDISEDPSIYKDPIFRWLYANSRQFKVLSFHLIQHYAYLLNNYRRSVSHMVVFRQNSPKNIKTIYNDFFGMFETVEEFSRALEMATENFGCLVVDMLNPSSKIEDRVFWYRAQYKQPDFIVGAEWWHKSVTKAYNENWYKEQNFEEMVEDMLPAKLKKQKEKEAAAASKKKKGEKVPKKYILVP